ncbi:hypothetical protein [Serratia ficaria]|uniref:hypothetical protein n=1 Tax=Serratia ficaria TaxID=61651 RepID=UPI002178C3DF|nr:hypothetical protein [Serratia ficaria]CAI0956261.1 Uncharacterised protein [Serratia ficaria]CAI1820314.1 Uncharacterised protein [Serratia ficaria]
MKIAIIIFFVLTLISALMQYFCHRRHKDELIVLYHKYTQSGHPLPPFVVIADNLGLIGVSLKAQWFRWILNGRKIKIGKNAFLSPKAYEFVNENTSQHLKSWMRKDFILSVLKMGCLALMCIFAFLSKA